MQVRLRSIGRRARLPVSCEVISMVVRVILEMCYIARLDDACMRV